MDSITTIIDTPKTIHAAKSSHSANLAGAIFSTKVIEKINAPPDSVINVPSNCAATLDPHVLESIRAPQILPLLNEMLHDLITNL